MGTHCHKGMWHLRSHLENVPHGVQQHIFIQNNYWNRIAFNFSTNPGNVQSSPGRVLYWPKAPRPTSSMLWAPLIPDSSFSNVLIAHNSRDLADSSMSFHFSAALCCTCTNPEYKSWSVNHILFCCMCNRVRQSTCARTNSPTLGKGSPPWVTNWELSFIISVNSSSARMISSTFSFRPATVTRKQMLHGRFLQYLTDFVLNRLSFLK